MKAKQMVKGLRQQSFFHAACVPEMTEYRETLAKGRARGYDDSKEDAYGD